MKHVYLFLSAMFILPATQLRAQTAADYAVQLTANVQLSPPQVKIAWKPLSGATGYTVYRKAKNAASWTTITTLTTSDSSYTDNNVIADSAYEYQVQKSGTVIATGYIYAGVRAPAIHNRGTMLLVVDSLFKDSCATQVKQLMNDLRGDGWQPVRHDVSRNVPVTAVKAMIVADYQSLPDVTAVLLLGHIAVPYSGDLNPDGHPDHLGAWPADVYYADMNGTWTDVSINDTAAARPQNRNKPGDGKWDQTVIPSDAELQVSRIDFANMPAFGKTEIQMMRAYLAKDHLYKMDSLAVIRRGLVDDNFGAFGGEAFAANAWRNFPGLLGNDSIKTLDFISNLNTGNYQWAYGCGGGSYTSAGGIGSTTDFLNKQVNSIFTMLFGSYFGDWDAQNDFMRAPLCADAPALTCAWAGRPNWHFQHMALGENIGYSTRLTQNNSSLYTANYGGRFVHIALMGDGSLRTDYIKPVSNLVISATPFSGATLTWNASPDAAVIGYYVYRAESLYGHYTLLPGMWTTPVYHDISGTNGKKYYLVRPVKLQQTPSGNYYNEGIGVADSAIVSYPTAIAGVSNTTSISVYPNPAGDKLFLNTGNEKLQPEVFYITDISGRLITVARMQETQNIYSFDIEHLLSGIYILHINTGFSVKWIKAN